MTLSALWLLTKEKPYQFFYKTSYSDVGFKTAIPSKKERPETNFTIRKLYNQPLEIDKRKYNGLIELCTKNQIIKKYHSFYKNLRYKPQEEKADGKEEKNEENFPKKRKLNKKLKKKRQIK